jgi:hypothetical protein
MRNEVIWGLRDAGDALDIYEYAFLNIVESRGTYWANRQRAWVEMRMSRPQFYKVRARLIDRGLLIAQEREGTTTTYMVNAEAVQVLANESLTKHSLSLSDHSPVSGE